MPTIKLTDQVGLDVDATTSAASSLAKYAASLTSLSLSNLNFKSLLDFTLADPPATALHTGINLNQPVDVGDGGVSLAIKAGVSGEIDIYVPPAKGGKLLDSDTFGDAIAVAPADRYVSVKLHATGGPDLSGSVNQLKFGFHAGADVQLSNHHLFATQPTAPGIAEAIRDTVAAFCIPGSVDDLKNLSTGSVVTLEGSGTVSFSAQANLFAATNPLASLQLPSPLPAIDVTAGGSVTVGAKCQLTWNYQLRVRKLDDRRVSLGLYRKSGSEFSISVNASEGIGVNVGETELVSSVFSAISKNAAADGDALKKLGMSDAQRDAIQAAVKGGAQRKLEVALQAALTLDHSSSAAFLYEFDLTILDAAGVSALAGALHGDLHSLTGAMLPAGVKVIRSIAEDVKKVGNTWKINLLGIFNFISTMELVSQGKVVFEPSTGDLVITDSATAERVMAASDNLRADTNKLRCVLAEHFLITAVYRGSPALISAPEITSSHCYFQSHADTGAGDMQKELIAATALNLLDPAGEAALLGATQDFGSTMVYAETSYDAALIGALFMNGPNPRPLKDFDDAGRQAIQLIVRADGDDAFRLLGVQDDDRWKKMRSLGPPSFATEVFPGLRKEQVDVIAVDYLTIVWWAGAMSKSAQTIAKMHGVLAVNPDPQSKNFIELREDLRKNLADVAGNTKALFGEPWGLVAMDLASGRRATAKVQITGPHFTLARQRQEIAAGTATD